MAGDIYTRKINWKWGIKHPNNRSFWRNVSANNNITMEEVREYQDYIVWSTLSSNYGFQPTVEFLEEFRDKIDWDFYTRYHGMEEKTYVRFKDRIDFTTWYHFSSRNRNENNFLEKYHNDIKDWGRMLVYMNTISLEMLEKYGPFFDAEAWGTISFRFELTEEIIKKYRDKLDREGLEHNRSVKREWLENF